jgi:phenylacetate-coenzyme A ligase PaaK-like adenylate-forming protein
VSAQAGAVPAPAEAVRLRHVEAKRRALPEHLERITWSGERLAEERQARLRALLRAAKASSPWHRRRLADLDPDRFEERELAVLPPMDKHDLMAHFDEIVTDPRLELETVERHLASLGDRPAYLLGRYQAICSSGSTGTRGVTVFGWDAWVTCYLGWFRYLLRAFAGQPFSLVFVAAGKAFHVSSALVQTFADPDAIATRSVPVTRPLEQIVAALNTIAPDVVATYPSALRLLTDAASTGRLEIRPRYLVTGGEPLLPEIRAAAEATFAAPVLNWWLCSEAGPLAIGCGRGPGLHLSDDLLIVEPVDQKGRPVPPGVLSDKVLVTNLYNPALPLIRYELTDEVVSLEDACPCGSAHRLVADVHGRLDDGFEYPDGVSVHAHVFRTILCDPAIVEYQVRQTPLGASISIRGGAGDLPRLHRELVEALQRAGLAEPALELAVVDEIERNATGKLKRFVPLAEPGKSQPSASGANH